MDLTRQPPRRPSNAQVAGIVGLARMIDKARGHNAGTIGEFKYGDDSGLDVEVLEFINMDAAEFAEAVDELDDETLGVMALERATERPIRDRRLQQGNTSPASRKTSYTSGYSSNASPSTPRIARTSRQSSPPSNWTTGARSET